MRRPELRQIIVTALLLMGFSVMGVGLVSLTQTLTAERIAYNEKAALMRKLTQIVPEQAIDNDITRDTLTLEPASLLGTDEPSEAYIGRRNGEVKALIFSPVAPDGYSGDIHLLVGVYTDGTIAGVRVVKHRETPGLGDYIEARKSDWILGLENRSLTNPEEEGWRVKRDGGVFDQFTGATITPRAVVKAVHNALLYFKANREKLLERARQSAAEDTADE